jgi:hypothetical protein
MFKYALKRVIRSYKLFIALTIGVLLATTFFASTNIAADILARDALEGTLEGVIYDFTVNSRQSNWTVETFDDIEEEIEAIDEVLEYSKTTSFEYTWNITEMEFDVYGIDWNSELASGIEIVSGRDTLEANETYIVAGSRNETQFSIDDIITVSINIQTSKAPFVSIIEWNFTIA